MLVLGLTLSELSQQWKPIALTTHKSISVVVLSIILLRIIWRLRNIQPLLPVNLPQIYISLAKLSHLLLYFCLLAMPISGLVMQSAAGKAVNIFGIYTLPNFVAPNHDLATFMRDAHSLIGYIVIGTIIIHILAGLFHHYRMKDDVLKNMLPNGLFKLKQ